MRSLELDTKEIFGGDNLKFVRKQPLFDQQNGIFGGVEGDGAEVFGASANGDIHF